MEDRDEELLNEQVLEIRYKPDARLLDHLGNWTTQLASQLGVSEWNVTHTRLDVFQKDDNQRAFISFRNAGCTLRNQDQQGFTNFTQNFLRFFFNTLPYRSLKIERIGVLGRFTKKYEGSFQDLLGNYSKNVYAIQPPFQKIIDAKVIDIGATINFKAANGFISTQTGPMEEKQLREFFTFAKEVPEIAIYFQIDYFFTPEITSSLNNNQISKLIQDYISENWTRFKLFSESISK